MGEEGQDFWLFLFAVILIMTPSPCGCFLESLSTKIPSSIMGDSESNDQQSSNRAGLGTSFPALEPPRPWKS